MNKYSVNRLVSMQNILYALRGVDDFNSVTRSMCLMKCSDLRSDLSAVQASLDAQADSNAINWIVLFAADIDRLQECTAKENINDFVDCVDVAIRHVNGAIESKSHQVNFVAGNDGISRKLTEG